MTAERPDAPSILVTGGAGYIGSHVTLALLEAGYRPVVLDNLVTGFRWAVDPRATFVEGCVEDSRLVGELVRTFKPQGVVHLAASTIVSQSVADPLKYYLNNTEASRALIESIVREGVPHLVFSSTAAVYGQVGSEPVSEDHPPQPETPYGRSKLMTEQMLADVAAAFAMNYCALRYFNVAGADPSGRTGSSANDATHLFKVAVEVATGQRSGMEVYGDDFATPDGTGIRDYIHVTDLAQAHVLALEALIAQPDASHVLNCGYGHGYSVLDVLGEVGRQAGQPLPFVMSPRRPGDLDRVIADNKRLVDLLAWRPKYDDLGLIAAHALQWQRRLAARANS